MAKQKSNDPCQDEFRKKLAAEKKLMAETSDEEIGKMYRLHREATEFFQARGLYV